MMTEPGKKYNKANTHRFAKNRGIDNSKWLTKWQIIDGLRVCRIKQEIARAKENPLRRQLMQNCLAKALEKDDKKKVGKIKTIMNGEKSRNAWNVIVATLNDPRLPPITAIERKEHGQTVTYSDSQGVNKVFREECEKDILWLDEKPCRHCQ